MNHSVALDMQSVQGTMLLPLWGRARYSRENPDILDDKTARDIIESCGVDFGPVEKTFGEFGGLCYIVRARVLEDAVRSYIAEHPQATVVNIGAGLDTSFSRVDNGQVRWYNLDLPDTVAYRRSLIPDSERETCIPKSFFDTGWFDDIAFREGDGIIFISGGVFFYFREEELRRVFDAMAKRFPGAHVYFDAESRRAVKFSNNAVKKTGNHGAMMHFHVNSARQLENWSQQINHISCFGFSERVPLKPSWSRSARMRFRILDALGMMKFVHMRFAPSGGAASNAE